MIPLIFHPIYSELHLPIRHRFPIEKYQGIYDALIQKNVPTEWFLTPTPLTPEKLSQVFQPTYVKELTTGTLDTKSMRRIGFPWSEQLIKRSLTACAGTVLTAQKALKHGKALNLTGGYHHAFADFGSGFCLFNDLYLAALTMLQNSAIDKVLIFDCDVHQGDGTAKLAQGNDAIITVSIHGEKNFPYRKQVSDFDFGLPKGTGDAEYLACVEEAFELAVRLHRPDAIIYDAGVDVHVDDDLGHLAVSTEGVYARDKYVFARAAQLDTPIAAVIGGGYQRDIDALVKVHLQLYRAAGVYM
jgi:acetoin utilization deacetylase AcuC-like enzyme